MGKKGSWFSAIKRVFIPSSKEKLEKELEKKNLKEKKKGRGILRHGESKAFIPLFREPSSIEKILGEADQQQLQFRPSTPYDQPLTPTSLPARSVSPRNASLRVSSPRHRAVSPRVTSPRNASPRVTSPKAATTKATSHRVFHPRPEPTLRYHHLSATKIQAAYRGYVARRGFRALRGLVRLQGVVRGQNVKRQTVNAMKHMQLLVRIQTQIQSRRIQMLENQAIQYQSYKNNVEAESTLGKWTHLYESDDHEDWDDSLLTKEEIAARKRKKVEAIVKRERAMAYAYSHQLWKGNQDSSQTPLTDMRTGGFPWWWIWMERQIPHTKPASEIRPMKSFLSTPLRPTPEHKPSPRPQSSTNRQHNLAYDNLETPTPRSSKSTVPARTKQMYTPSGTPQTNMSNFMKYSRPRMSAGDSNFDVPLKDDDSLMSCPPFSVPNYMTPTASAKAKLRPNSNPKERFPGTPGTETSKRRFSFPLAPSIGSFKWNKGGSSKNSTSQTVLVKQQPLHSVGDRSVDSAVSMPAVFGRKPFNRFV